ncbi:MAG: NADH-quinone oxidoreductase subunit D [Deltaproteobacteria bacterium]|nr:MAG: NADH-quinone oxidoreductase subunit D [Deltaproteobacteria bacterium]
MSDLILQYDTGDEITVNMGPQHPSTHGVIRFIVRTDGEIMAEADPDVGYLHRSIEHIAEKCTYEGFMPYTDRVDYVCAMTANHAWATAVEKLADIEVPERAEYLRVISDEFNRISSHCIALGAMAMDIGAITPFPYALREREYVNDLLEELCGARLTYNYHRIGGVGWDMTDAWRDKALRFLDRFEPIIDEFNRLITGNPIFIKRLANMAVITREEAIDYGLVGPNLRASGVDFDVRRDEPYSVYPKLEFDVPVGRGEHGTTGDSWDRFWVRVEEWRQSVRILRQALDLIQTTPKGEFWNKPKKLKPKGEAHSRVEAARGDMLCYVIGDGTTNAYRARFRTGSFNAMQVIRDKSAGLMVADLVALIASLDIVAPEIDR